MLAGGTNGGEYVLQTCMQMVWCYAGVCVEGLHVNCVAHQPGQKVVQLAADCSTPYLVECGRHI